MARRADILHNSVMGTGTGLNKYFKYLSLPALALLLSLPASRNAYSSFGESAAVLLEVMERMTTDLAAPPVTFFVRNNSGQADLFADAGTDLLKAAKAWQIQVFDQGGRKISFIQGRGVPSLDVIPWSGMSGGQSLPDGFYKARFVWLDAANRPHATEAATVSLATPLEISRLYGMKLQVDYTPEGLMLTFRESMIFLPGETRIMPAAVPALREIAGFLKAYPRNRVQVRGHTDSSGSLQRNALLSGQRAAGLCRYLGENGIAAERLEYNGMGSARPVASNATEAGRARNRRVEVIILKTAG